MTDQKFHFSIQYAKGKTIPVDANDEIWDEDYDVHANLPTEPTPVYKPEE